MKTKTGGSDPEGAGMNGVVSAGSPQDPSTDPIAALASLGGGPQEKELREEIWLNHGCGCLLPYGDDGEMQCCGVDFKRTPIPEIVRQLNVKAQQRAANARPNGAKEPNTEAAPAGSPQQSDVAIVLTIDVFREDDGRFAAEYQRENEAGMGEYSSTPIGALAELISTLIKVEEDNSVERRQASSARPRTGSDDGHLEGTPETLANKEVDSSAALLVGGEGWHPIETAPKDGTWILMQGPDSKREGYWTLPAVAQWSRYANCWHSMDGLVVGASLWHVLPSPLPSSPPSPP